MRMVFASIVLAVVAVFAVGQAHASVILVDEQDVDRQIRAGQSVTVAHDMSDVIPDVYEAEAGALILVFTNDLTRDRAEVRIGDDSFGIVVGRLFDFEIFGLTAQALANLNADGILEVTITAVTGWLLPFTWASSTLIVSATPVPEPAVLALFGAGLLALALMRRRIA